MKNLTILFLVFALGISFSLTAQEDKSKRPSPPAKAEATIGDLTIEIDYSRPGVKGRTIWGMLVPYGKVWRTGANEATTFEVNQDVLIEGQPLPAGKYALFTIPGEKEWTVLFNKEADQWGAYNYDESKNALDSVKVPAGKADAFTEQLTFDIEKTGPGAGTVHLQWENVRVSFDVSRAK